MTLLESELLVVNIFNGILSYHPLAFRIHNHVVCNHLVTFLFSFYFSITIGGFFFFKGSKGAECPLQMASGMATRLPRPDPGQQPRLQRPGTIRAATIHCKTYF